MISIYLNVRSQTSKSLTIFSFCWNPACIWLVWDFMSWNSKKKLLSTKDFGISLNATQYRNWSWVFSHLIEQSLIWKHSRMFSMLFPAKEAWIIYTCGWYPKSVWSPARIKWPTWNIPSQSFLGNEQLGFTTLMCRSISTEVRKTLELAHLPTFLSSSKTTRKRSKSMRDFRFRLNSVFYFDICNVW